MDSVDTLLGEITSRPPRYVAVSGGVDSLTLATFAHRNSSRPVTAVHAISPAVPTAATERVRHQAAIEGWDLEALDSGEFADPRYRANPVDRCYFCKSNLYRRIRELGPGLIAAGTNTDDLSDFRPGLQAAAEYQVSHPFVEAGLNKSAVRSLARSLGLRDIAELPAQPCLSSRVRTGISIGASDLSFVEHAESSLNGMFGRSATLRCRIVDAGVVIEVGADLAGGESELHRVAAGLCSKAGRNFLGVTSYVRGSMFVRS